MNKLEKKCITFLKKIISTKSLSREEYELSEIIKKEMIELGYNCVKRDKYFNVAGKIGNGKTKILFDAHTDTIDVTDINSWKTNPFKSVEKNGRIYGRGASDDKGCVAAMVYAGAEILRKKMSGDYTLMVSASAREEIGGKEWLNFIINDLGFKPDYAIIGEPSALKIIYGHKGRAEFKVTIKGRAAHAGIPQKGENAIYKTMPIIAKIEKLNRSLKTGILGEGVISVTKIETNAPSINSIPESCSFYIDRRTVETENKKYVFGQIKNLLAAKGTIDYEKYYSPWIMNKRDRLVSCAQNTFIGCYGKKPEIVVWPFCTNGSFTMGDKNIPTIGFGPGAEEQAHVANEFIKISEVLGAIKFYSQLPSFLSL